MKSINYLLIHYEDPEVHKFSNTAFDIEVIDFGGVKNMHSDVEQTVHDRLIQKKKERQRDAEYKINHYFIDLRSLQLQMKIQST